MASHIAESLKEAQTGSKDALGDALQGCRGYLLTIAGHQLEPRLRVKGEAADLVQDTFLEAQRDFERFHGDTEEAWLAWLRQLLLHNIANFRRSFHTAKREVESEVPLPQKGLSAHVQLGLATPEPSPIDEVMAREQANLIHSAMERLPQDDRQVLLLRYEDNQSFEEISRRTGRSANAVRKHFGRAIQKLQSELEISL